MNSFAKLARLLFSCLLFAVVLPAGQDNLQQWYASYNHDYFNDELPKDIRIYKLHDDELLGLTECTVHGKECSIGINYHLQSGSKQRQETLQHEMCHLQLEVEDEVELDQHGPKWQACMLRLANAGAMKDLW